VVILFSPSCGNFWVASIHNLPPNPQTGEVWSNISNGPLLKNVSCFGVYLWAICLANALWSLILISPSQQQEFC
jgi:hypothetical protein